MQSGQNFPHRFLQTGAKSVLLEHAALCWLLLRFVIYNSSYAQNLYVIFHLERCRSIFLLDHQQPHFLFAHDPRDFTNQGL